LRAKRHTIIPETGLFGSKFCDCWNTKAKTFALFGSLRDVVPTITVALAEQYEWRGEGSASVDLRGSRFGSLSALKRDIEFIPANNVRTIEKKSIKPLVGPVILCAPITTQHLPGERANKRKTRVAIQRSSGVVFAASSPYQPIGQCSLQALAAVVIHAEHRGWPGLQQL
jgi:hypothetical protein